MEPTVSNTVDAAPVEEWRTYDEFAAGIDTYRLPDADLSGQNFLIRFDDGPQVELAFLDSTTVRWSSTGVFESTGSEDPYEAVTVRADVLFVNVPFVTRERESLTLVLSTTTHRALGVLSAIQPEAVEEVPQVAQHFWTGVVDGGAARGVVPGPSRDLVGRRNLYRYSPEHLYEHVYLSSERYAWQCIQGVQRGHGDVDMSTVWKFDDGLYLFCFREFKIAVASVWLHDLGYQLRTTGNFLGLNGEGDAEHSRAGGHIYPVGSVVYPDVQPV
ncbi:MoaF C-terminal domain-containing protein [Microbacterium pygmaeum]|uniref:Molybdenum cofactor biosynthesis protein F n=1 Tax=Microbacterium pygmaeum TaxID=370764 RepID=A0A1G7X7Z7_9MICO|nr:MoaF C-terminal domain-containing protein [Microbacterium pygmaeum]SDG80284.1 Molybdenum cofactor biosynthesis protein F [Microbacterium pygmaeum]